MQVHPLPTAGSRITALRCKAAISRGMDWDRPSTRTDGDFRMLTYRHYSPDESCCGMVAQTRLAHLSGSNIAPHPYRWLLQITNGQVTLLGPCCWEEGACVVWLLLLVTYMLCSPSRPQIEYGCWLTTTSGNKCFVTLHIHNFVNSLLSCEDSPGLTIRYYA